MKKLINLIVLVAIATSLNAQTYLLILGASGPGNPGSGSGYYPAGTSVTLTAIPIPGSSFLGWTGSLTSTANPVTITVNSNMTITANFGSLPKLTIVANPSGSGTFSPQSGIEYVAGTNLTVTATPNKGYRFVSWSGFITSTYNPVNITTGNSDMTITGTFVELPKYTLTTAVTTLGTGTISPADGTTYYEGDKVSVTANPATGYSFSGWSDAATGSVNSVNITMDADKKIIATFIPTPNVWQQSGTKIYYNDGNVGIGTTSPNNKLEVIGGNSYFDPNYNLYIPSIGSSYFWKGSDGVDNVRFSVWDKLMLYNPTSAGLNTNNSGWNIQLGARDGSIYTRGGAYFAINTGNLGVGTQTPSEKLEVNGNVKAASFIGDGSQLTGITGTGSSQWTTNGSNIYYNTGNIGIGTTTPQYTLDVNGTVTVNNHFRVVGSCVDDMVDVVNNQPNLASDRDLI
jgi:hypothetical protein